jgi:uncharacterized protein YjbJ (UPF0337 family)
MNRPRASGTAAADDGQLGSAAAHSSATAVKGDGAMAGRKTQAKGKTNTTVGSVKKAAGKATKNGSLEVKGVAQKAKGKTQDLAGNLHQKISDEKFLPTS